MNNKNKPTTHSAGLEPSRCDFRKEKVAPVSQISNDSDSPAMDKDEKYGITDRQFNTSSVNDCTGAVPTPPQTDAELESYLDVYEFLPTSVPEDEY